MWYDSPHNPHLFICWIKKCSLLSKQPNISEVSSHGTKMFLSWTPAKISHRARNPNLTRNNENSHEVIHYRKCQESFVQTVIMVLINFLLPIVSQKFFWWTGRNKTHRTQKKWNSATEFRRIVLINICLIAFLSDKFHLSFILIYRSLFLCYILHFVNWPLLLIQKTIVKKFWNFFPLFLISILFILFIYC